MFSQLNIFKPSNSKNKNLYTVNETAASLHALCPVFYSGLVSGNTT